MQEMRSPAFAVRFQILVSKWRFRTVKVHTAIRKCGGSLGDPLAGAGLPRVIVGSGWVPLGRGPVGYLCEIATIVHLRFQRGFCFVLVLGSTPVYRYPNVWGIFNVIVWICYSHLLFPPPLPSRPNYAQSCRRPFPHTFG